MKPWPKTGTTCVLGEVELSDIWQRDGVKCRTTSRIPVVDVAAVLSCYRFRDDRCFGDCTRRPSARVRACTPDLTLSDHSSSFRTFSLLLATDERATDISPPRQTPPRQKPLFTKCDGPCYYISVSI